MVDVKDGITIAASNKEEVVAHSVVCAQAAGVPASGSVAFDISKDKSYAMLLAGRVAGLSAFNLLSLGIDASKDVVKLTPVQSAIRYGEDVTTIPTLTGGAVAADQEFFSMVLINVETMKVELYQDVNLGGVALVDSADITEAMLKNFTLTDRLTLHGVGFEQPTYGMSFISFTSAPVMDITELNYTFAQWRAGHPYLPKSWKNA